MIVCRYRSDAEWHEIGMGLRLQRKSKDGRSDLPKTLWKGRCKENRAFLRLYGIPLCVGATAAYSAVLLRPGSLIRSCCSLLVFASRWLLRWHYPASYNGYSRKSHRLDGILRDSRSIFTYMNFPFNPTFDLMPAYRHCIILKRGFSQARQELQNKCDSFITTGVFMLTDILQRFVIINLPDIKLPFE